MKIVYIIIVVLVVFGCNQSTESIPEPNIIWNLQVGNNWTYLDSVFTNNNVQIKSFSNEIIKQIEIDYQEEDIILSCLIEEPINGY